MKLTDYALGLVMDGRGWETKTIVESDLYIKFGKSNKHGMYLDIYLVKHGETTPFAVVQENIFVESGGTILIESPDGFMNLPVELRTE